MGNVQLITDYWILFISVIPETFTVYSVSTQIYSTNEYRIAHIALRYCSVIYGL
jgi:hypothetical protein